MNDEQWLKEYRRALELSRKYDEAKKYGATVPGNRKRENQMILVQRGEAVDLARGYKQSVQVSRIHLEKFVMLWAYMRDVAKITAGHLTCGTCGQPYIPLPENSECPFCRIERLSSDSVQSAILGEARGKPEA